jgi:hypothetical protein
MTTDADNWIAVAHRLGIDIIAPFHVELSGVQAQFTALLPQFGAQAGMVVDANWDTIQPHQSSLLAAGYGFSCAGAPEAEHSIDDMLSDWGWSGRLPKPDWLKP